MSDASDLIEHIEAAQGCRIDDNDGDNNAMNALIGAMSRLMGKSPKSYRERDDVAAGMYIRHKNSPQGQHEDADREGLLAMLEMGFSPDEIMALKK